MSITKLLIANRGEIAIRIARAATELGIHTLAIFSEDDTPSRHTQQADEAHPLHGTGVAAYLDGDQIVALAKAQDCDAIHPGYGFLSENAAFAQRCVKEGITFVGPRAELLNLFGNKVKARVLAERAGIPVLLGTSEPTTLAQARDFLNALDDGEAMMIKAIAGGGGRGMRMVQHAPEVEDAYVRCQSEAQAAFGNSDLYVERVMPRARHIEVQIMGDGSGRVSHLGERECSIQRRHQKLVEIAPSPGLSLAVRESLTAAAIQLAEMVRFDNIGTVEFLVAAATADDETEGTARRTESAFAFIEVNPRLQVEHTVTEEVMGVDLVKAQLQLAAGHSLDELGLTQEHVLPPRGFAMQVRINTETMLADASIKPASGTITAFEPPLGPGVRVDSYGYVGYTTNPRFDSLLAKLICHVPTPDFATLITRTQRALAEFKIDGVATNIPFLQKLLQHPEFVAHRLHTRFVADYINELVDLGEPYQQALFTETNLDFQPPVPPSDVDAKPDVTDPLAVLDYGKTTNAGTDEGHTSGGALSTSPESTSHSTTSWVDELLDNVARAEHSTAIRAPLHGTIISINVGTGDHLYVGQPLLVIEAMKMENVVVAAKSGIVQRLVVATGDAVAEGDPLLFIEETEVTSPVSNETAEIDLDHVRPDLAEVHQRHASGLDDARSDAVARRRKTGQRTARENIEDLCDPGTFIEYGPLVIAAQRQRRAVAELIERTPADGLVAGVGSVNGTRFDEFRTQCIVMSYDYTVLAGTQGHQNHRKKDRMFALAERQRLPVVVLAEGGGGRPGDTDGLGVTGLDCLAFHEFAKLSGRVPLVGITSGRCFAGNALLLGCCDVVIATEGSNIGMGGPAMIEGGGLGIFRPEEVGPLDVQVANGVVDIAVADEAAAVQAAKQYLAYFQGTVSEWACADQRLLRAAIPENRLRVYDVRTVIETLADTDSVLELRPAFAQGMVTAFMRVEGRPLGVIANNPTHLAGAITSNGADKAARFMQLCDAFDMPLLFLCDTPGIMVGPEAEKTGLVRHAARMFVTGASLRVPFFTIVLRKCYGLGGQAMAGGTLKAPLFTVSWPTGEFGGMGLEGAVKLGYRKELAALDDPAERQALYEEMVASLYEQGKAVNVASHFELDDVIDPMVSRRWILGALRSAQLQVLPERGRRSYVKTR